jgi:hypothetical protein
MRTPPRSSLRSNHVSWIARIIPQGSTGQLRDRAKRRLRSVEAEPEVLVGIGRVAVGGLMVVRVPAQ